jgi:hypothetical protein
MNKDEILELALKIMKFEFEAKLRENASIAISGYSPKFPIKRTGNLTRNIKVKAIGHKLVITMPYYGKYIEYGTGIFGPHKTPIVATNKKALSFGGFVFKSVAGRPPTPFIRPTLHKDIQKLVKESIQKAIKILQNGNSQ